MNGLPIYRTDIKFLLLEITIGYLKRIIPTPEVCLDKSIIYLQDSSVEIGGLKIYGSPSQPRFFDWAFNLMRGAELAEKWKLIPNDTDILITHGPPFGILDEVPRQYFIENTGCEELRKRVETIKPKLHVFGHIHCGYGATEKFGVKFVNASNCDESYEPTNAPVVIDSLREL